MGMAIFGLNVGHPIEPMGTLWCSCAKVHEAIKLPFGMVSGVPQAVVYYMDRGMRGFGGFSHCFEWQFWVYF